MVTITRRPGRLFFHRMGNIEVQFGRRRDVDESCSKASCGVGSLYRVVTVSQGNPPCAEDRDEMLKRQDGRLSKHATLMRRDPYRETFADHIPGLDVMPN
jgi:hypothetical protein